MNRFKAKFYEVEAAEGLSREERRERLKVYIENVYAVLPTNISRTMPQIRQDILKYTLLLLKLPERHHQPLDRCQNLLL